MAIRILEYVCHYLALDICVCDIVYVSRLADYVVAYVAN